jgi:purine-binding chemotaxis protein CheW
MNLRGEVLSVIDLKRFFGLDPGDPGADHVIVVVEYGGMRTGLLVDSIGDLVNLATGELSEEPLLPGKSQRGFFEGAALRDEVLVSIIRLEGILESEGMYSRQG